MHQGDISVQQTNGVAVVMLEGEHDVYTAPSVTGRIDSFLSEGVPVVVDLSRASFIDSSILRALIVARNGSQEKSLGFAVCLDQSEDSAVQRVFEVARAQELFPILSSQAEAIEKVRSVGDGAG
jgi:anti-sigma B factor antagonist